MELDQLIIGLRIKQYQAGKKNEKDVNSVSMPSVEESLEILKKLDDARKTELKQAGQPDCTINFYSLDAEAMKNYLLSIQGKANQYCWGKTGQRKNSANCASFVWETLNKGGIQKYLPSYVKLFRTAGLTISSIAFPMLFESAWFILASIIVTTAGLSMIGGMMDAQKPIDALFRVINANQPNSVAICSVKTVMWFAGTLLSGIASGVLFDNALEKIYISPDMVLAAAMTAKQVELSSYTLGPPKTQTNEQTQSSDIVYRAA